jgi:hypothetical protein
VREAVQKGYVIIAPEYRGSTGYGEKHYLAIDYGGYEIDDTISAVDYLKTLPHVDADRLGIMGWSHGGFIALHSVFREKHPFRASVAMVPVTNLFFRLSCRTGLPAQLRDHGAVLDLPFEKREICKGGRRSVTWTNCSAAARPHVATNDTDVNFEEAEADHRRAARAKTEPRANEGREPDAGPTSVGHTFNRRTNTQTLQRDDSPTNRSRGTGLGVLGEKNLAKR